MKNEVQRILTVPRDLRDFPKRIQIEISNICNLDCIYCTLKDNMPDKATMSQETFSRILPYMKYMRGVSFCGNAEALMNKNVSSFIRQIKKKSKGVYISIFTNAELLTEKYSREFIEYGLDSLVFSIDGVKPELVDSVRKKGSLETILSNIERLQRIKEETGSKLPIVSATLVMYKKNYKQIPDVLRLLRKIGVLRLNVNGLEPYSESFLDEILWNDPSTFPEIIEVLNESVTIAKELGIELLVANLIPQSGNCTETEIPIILANGDVVPCSVLSYPRPGYYSVSDENCPVRTENYKKQLIFGNINVNTLHEIWFDPDYVDFRQKVVSKEFPKVCRNCLVKHRFICVRPEWSVNSVLNELAKAVSVVSAND
ncbi:radical SAM protein [candidate division KSB1 bacterium]